MTGSPEAPQALILTYHAVEKGPPPLCVEPELFRAHVACIAESGIRAVTLVELAEILGRGDLREPLVAITFDDGFASVGEVAAPLLAALGLPATVFCVAGCLGGRNAWGSGRTGSFGSELGGGRMLADLARQGFEIGSHGTTHAPLIGEDQALLRTEVVESRAVLESVAETAVRSFAYPYGAAPSGSARRLVEETYDSACTTRLSRVAATADRFELPRVDAHYLRRPALLRLALAGRLDTYLVARRLGARARRLALRDYARQAPEYGLGPAHSARGRTSQPGVERAPDRRQA